MIKFTEKLKAHQAYSNKHSISKLRIRSRWPGLLWEDFFCETLKNFAHPIIFLGVLKQIFAIFTKFNLILTKFRVLSGFLGKIEKTKIKKDWLLSWFSFWFLLLIPTKQFTFMLKNTITPNWPKQHFSLHHYHH
jgi:hypothetical protein